MKTDAIPFFGNSKLDHVATGLRPVVFSTSLYSSVIEVNEVIEIPSYGVADYL